MFKYKENVQCNPCCIHSLLSPICIRVEWDSKVYVPDLNPKEIQADPFSLEMTAKTVKHLSEDKGADKELALDIGYSIKKV